MSLSPVDDSSSVEDSLLFVSTKAVVRELDWDVEVFSFEVEVDTEKHYAAIRMSDEQYDGEYDDKMPVCLIIRPQDILNVRVLRQKEADKIVQGGLWYDIKRKWPNTGAIAITISKKPSALVLGPSDGVVDPQFDDAKRVLNLFKEMARSFDLKIFLPSQSFTDDQLHTLRHALKAYELYPDELTKPFYKGLKVINEHEGLPINDLPTSSDESVPSRSPSPVPGGRSRAPRATKKRKRAVVDDGSPSGDDLHPGIADNLQQLEERLTQKMNAQCEEKVQRMLAESKDAILSEVDARLNARLAEIRADIANKPYEPREGEVADLDRELELKIEARLPSLREELRERVCEDVKARLISGLAHESSAS